MSFGRLRERLWNNHNVSIRVKGKIYRAIILPTLLYEDQMARQCDKHKSSQAVRIPFYGRTRHQEESPLDRTSFEDANQPHSETGSLLAATRRTTTTWLPMYPLQRHNQEKSKEKGH